MELDTTFAPNDIVRCVRGHSGAPLIEGALYRVVVVCIDYQDYRDITYSTGQHKEVGVIVVPLTKEHVYPYVWDVSRFVKEPLGISSC